jgi:hypothetical protein
MEEEDGGLTQQKLCRNQLSFRASGVSIADRQAEVKADTSAIADVIVGLSNKNAYVTGWAT